jgi:hypothetical protein
MSGPRHPVFDALRAAEPIHFNEPTRTFVLTRFADGRALLTDPDLWRDPDEAEDGALVKSFKPKDMNRPGDRDSGIGFMDNPAHARIRPPIAIALNRRAQAMRPFLQDFTRRRLDALAGRDSFDVVADYAMPIPIAAIGRVLGVDTSDMEQFRAWSEAAIDIFSLEQTPERRAATRAAADAIMDFLDGAMAERRAAPRDDIISDLLAVQAVTGQLSDSEIRVNCMNLLLGGNVTTADLIGNAIWLLLTHPAELAKLRADPALIVGAIEETLRLEPPTDGTQRIASRDLEFHGCPVKPRQVVAVLLHAANRDPAQFTEPHRFDITRREGPHLAFGGGAHMCIGAPLARLEAQVAVAEIVARFPELRLADPAAEPQWRAVDFIHGLTTLPVRV